MPLVTPTEIPDNALLLDARLAPNARAKFEAGHLRGAVFVDVERDLTGDASDPSREGRHPLPAIEDWSQTLGRWGVVPDRPVTVYDHASGAHAAARLWWMLCASGHPNVTVLNGGLTAALDASLELETGASRPTPGEPYPVSAWILPIATLATVKAHAADPRWRVVDVRAAERYRGETEPFEPTAGHIPGAISLPLTASLDSTGRFKSPDALRALYQGALGDVPTENVIVSCGSGVTACHTLLGMAAAGLEGARLYVGSFSQWSRQGNPVRTGEAP